MKVKILLTVLSFLALSPVAFAPLDTVVSAMPSTVTLPTNPIADFTSTSWTGDTSIAIFGGDNNIMNEWPAINADITDIKFYDDGSSPGGWLRGIDYRPGTASFLASDGDPEALGTWHIVTFSNSLYLLDSNRYCTNDIGYNTGHDYQDCIASAQAVGGQVFSFTVYPATESNGFILELANATSTFSATTGFDVAGVITWAGDNLIKLFIGSGLAVLLALRGWIVALVIIGSIVYFAYRAFRFFRH